MILNILLVIIILALLNSMGISFMNYVVFTILNQGITIYNLLVLAIMIYLIGLLPRPFKEIVGLILVLWILSFLGIIFVGGLSNILIIAIVIVLLLNIFR